MEEIFKDIPNYNGKYQASNLGNIKSLNYNRTGVERCLVKTINSKGYYNVSLWMDGIMRTRNVHQLVAETFLNHTPCGYNLIVDHIDNDSLNNNVKNLQLTTPRINVSKDVKGRTSNYTGVCWDKRRGKWLAQIKIKGKKIFLGRFNCQYDAHIKYLEAKENLEQELLLLF